LILQAEALSDRQSKASREQAESIFRQALVITPNEARAWAGLTRVYINQAISSERPQAEGVRLAREAADKALAIDPDNVIAIAALGRLASDFDFDLPTAARHIQRASELEPANLVSLNAAAIGLMSLGRADDAIRLMEYRVAHDPANPTAYNNLGNALYVARQWDAAIDAFRSAIRLSPEYVGVRQGLGATLL